MQKAVFSGIGSLTANNLVLHSWGMWAEWVCFRERAADRGSRRQRRMWAEPAQRADEGK